MKFIGIDKLFYLSPITEDLHLGKDKLVALMNDAATKEVKNIHEGTFQYSHDDPEVTDYVNEVDGKTYYRDKKNDGTKSIAWSQGDYTLEEKADLQGGTYKDGIWSTNDTQTFVYKAVIAKLKTGNFVVFSNASIIAKVDTQEKGLMLGVTATATASDTEGVEQEYWFSPDGITYNKTTKKWVYTKPS